MTQTAVARPNTQDRVRITNWRHFWQELDTRPIELALATIAMAWGLWVMNPYLHTFAIKLQYNIMIQLMPEEGWGLWSFFMSMFRLVGLMTGVNKIRVMVCFLGCISCVYVATSAALENLASASVPIYSSFALMNLVVLLRLLRKRVGYNG